MESINPKIRLSSTGAPYSLESLSRIVRRTVRCVTAPHPSRATGAHPVVLRDGRFVTRRRNSDERPQSTFSRLLKPQILLAFILS
jgi:hypothetical protein